MRVKNNFINKFFVKFYDTKFNFELKILNFIKLIKTFGIDNK